MYCGACAPGRFYGDAEDTGTRLVSSPAAQMLTFTSDSQCARHVRRQRNGWTHAGATESRVQSSIRAHKTFSRPMNTPTRCITSILTPAYASGDADSHSRLLDQAVLVHPTTSVTVSTEDWWLLLCELLWRFCPCSAEYTTPLPVGPWRYVSSPSFYRGLRPPPWTHRRHLRGLCVLINRTRMTLEALTRTLV